MSYNYYIGVDISKHTLDFTVLREAEFILHEVVNNNKESIQLFLKTIMTIHKAGGKRTLFCVENTGLYTRILQSELVRRKVPLWLQSPMEIKLSMGMQRGKNDKVDSLRIAQYAFTHRRKAVLWQEPREIIEHLKKLRSLRERLISAANILKKELKEVEGFVKRPIHQSMVCHCQCSLKTIAEDLQGVSASIMETIKGDERLARLYTWLTSVPAIGTVLATEMIIATNEFKSFTSPKKFACHCGVVPFRYTSGTSLQGKAKVSKRANQRMKQLLHMAALATISREGDYKLYYQRRVKEGLAKMSVLNAVRNKIIHRAFACVREERMYVK